MAASSSTTVVSSLNCKYCNKEFSSPYKTQKHESDLCSRRTGPARPHRKAKMNLDTIDHLFLDIFKKHICPICFKSYSNYESARRHFGNEHLEARFECDCGESFREKSQFTIHQKTCNGKAKKRSIGRHTFYCRFKGCSKKFTGNMSLCPELFSHEDHDCEGTVRITRDFKTDGVNVCASCGMGCNTRNFSCHKTTCAKTLAKYESNPPEFNCQICIKLGMGLVEKSFTSNIMLTTHSHKIHPFSCFEETHLEHHKTLEELKLHIKSSHLEGYKPFVCKYCKVVLISEEERRYHHHCRHGLPDTDEISCSLCEPPHIISGWKELHSHILGHYLKAAEAPPGYGCDKCNYVFEGIDDLNKHRKLCIVTRLPFICYKCDRVIGGRGQKHVSKCSRIKNNPLECIHCMYVASELESLKIHNAIVHGIYADQQEFKCNRNPCTRTFPNQRSLDHHIQFHDCIDKTEYSGGDILQYLVLPKPISEYPGTRRCGKNCNACGYIITRPRVRLGNNFVAAPGFYSCSTEGVLYSITCSFPGCDEFYIGMTTTKFRIRVSQHLYELAKGTDRKVYNHFRNVHGKDGHTYLNVEILYKEKEKQRNNPEWKECLKKAESQKINEHNAKNSLNTVSGKVLDDYVDDYGPDFFEDEVDEEDQDEGEKEAVNENSANEEESEANVNENLTNEMEYDDNVHNLFGGWY